MCLVCLSPPMPQWPVKSWTIRRLAIKLFRLLRLGERLINVLHPMDRQARSRIVWRVVEFLVLLFMLSQQTLLVVVFLLMLSQQTLLVVVFLFMVSQQTLIVVVFLLMLGLHVVPTISDSRCVIVHVVPTIFDCHGVLVHVVPTNSDSRGVFSTSPQLAVIRIHLVVATMEGAAIVVIWIEVEVTGLVIIDLLITIRLAYHPCRCLWQCSQCIKCP